MAREVTSDQVASDKRDNHPLMLENLKLATLRAVARTNAESEHLPSETHRAGA